MRGGAVVLVDHDAGDEDPVETWTREALALTPGATLVWRGEAARMLVAVWYTRPGAERDA